MGNPKNNQSQVLKKWYQLFLEQFPGEINEPIYYTNFSSKFKKTVLHLQSLGKKHCDKNLLLAIFLLKNGVMKGNKRKNTKRSIVWRVSKIRLTLQEPHTINNRLL